MTDIKTKTDQPVPHMPQYLSTGAVVGGFVFLVAANVLGFEADVIPFIIGAALGAAMTYRGMTS